MTTFGGTRAYTPGREGVTTLRERTVGRERVLARLEAALRAAATTGNRSHTLLVAPRGNGKSHVLSIVIDLVERDPELASGLCVVTVPEDAVGFTRFDDLLGLSVSSLGGESSPGLSHDGAQHQIGLLLGGRTLLLVIENFDRVLGAFGAGGERAFRAWVETSAHVLVLASTPLLFPGVADRDKPWFGAFDTIALRDLTPDEGHQLLLRQARAADDHALVDMLLSETGRRRVRALAELTGGSPRIWMVLADCLTPRKLDQLIPAVHDLLEKLTPYYQQLLWSLAPNEQRIVRALAEGERPSLTVSEIATAAELATGTSAQLKRLAAARWVEKVAVPGGDKRRTLYRLREPLLRHHLQYRSNDRGPLALIVTILRVIYDPDVRLRHLRSVEPDSPALPYLAATFADRVERSDQGWASRDVAELHQEARLWVAESGRWSRAEAGKVIDALVTDARAEVSDESALADLAGEWLRDAASRATGRTAQLLTLVSACWDGRSDAVASRERLIDLLKQVEKRDPLALSVRDEIAFWTGESGDPVAAADQFASVLADRTRLLGPDHPDTLSTRHNLAYQLGETGDHTTAATQLTALLNDRTRILGPDHPHTLTTRYNLAYQLGETGDHTTAATQLTALLNDRTRILGPDHPHTLTTRHNLAHELGETGDHTTAATQLTALLNDRTRILGPDHPHTLTTRHNLAHELGETGDHTTAATQLTALLNDRTRILGPDHPHTLTTRHNLAYQLGETGDHTTAATQLTALLNDRTRILGPDHPHTLTTRHNLAYQLGETGDHTTAATQLTALLNDRTRILGPDHPHTLTTRHNLAHELGETGDHTTAATQLTTLLNDQDRILGPDHPDTLTTRHHLAYQLGETGDHTTAATQLTALLNDRTRILGPDHPHTLTTRHNLAHQLGETGDHTTAATQLTTLLNDQDRILGPDHPHTLTTRHNLAYQLGETGDHTTAATQFTALLNDRTRILGPDHPHTLTTRHNLAYQLGETGDHTTAATQLTTLLNDRTRIHGPDHPRRWSTLLVLLNSMRLAGQLDLGLDVALTALATPVPEEFQTALIALTSRLILDGLGLPMGAADTPGALRDVRAAAAGDAEAVARLPQELMNVIDMIASTEGGTRL